MQNNSNNPSEERAFLFYPSFARSLDLMPADVQLEVYRAISHYGCLGTPPEQISPMAMAMFELIKPQIDASVSRYEKAARGGAPKGSCNNPNGRRGKQASVSEGDTTEDLPHETPSEQTQELTETNLLTNPETKNKLNIEDKEEVKYEIEYNCSRNYTSARQEFLDDYFGQARQPAISKQLKALGVTDSEYRLLVEQVLDDWELNGPIPATDNDLRSRMLCTVRKKHRAQQQSAKRSWAPLPANLRPQGDANMAVHDNAYYENIESSSRQREEAYSAPFLTGDALARKLASFSLDNDSALRTPVGIASTLIGM